jgi:hypothetical protein
MDIARQRTLVETLEKLSQRAHEQARLAEESRRDLSAAFIAEQNRLNDMMQANLDDLK